MKKKISKKEVMNQLDFNAIVANEQLHLATRLFDSLVEGIMITDTSGVILYVNKAFTEITGYDYEAIGQTPRILKSGKHDRTFYQNLWRDVENYGQWKGEIWNQKKNGESYIQWSTITVVKDELGNSMYYTAVISDITDRKKEEEQLKSDLFLAREVQKGMLTPPINDDYIEIVGFHSPSIMLGGDMYAWYMIEEGKYGVFLMDVMGHGIASSLVSMSIQSLLRGMIKRVVDPKKVMKELNQHIVTLFRNNESSPLKKYYITALYVVVDTNNQRLQYASAGHPPGLFIDGKGTVIELDVGTIPLGMLSEIEVQTGEISYTSESKLILYTDGLFSNEQKGTRENIESLRNFLIEHRENDTKTIISEMVSLFSEPDQSKEYADDITVVAATIFK